MNIDLAIFGTFLALSLIVGLLCNRHNKTLKDYAIGTKNFSTATITATIVATSIGGGFMFYGLSNTYRDGLYFIIPMIGWPVGVLFTGQVLAVRMGEFMHNVSVAEAMGKLYGRLVQFITGLSGIIKSLGGIAIQFKVITNVFNLLFGWEGTWVTVVAATIVIIYSAFGGIRAVTFTDVLQFITFCIFVPILGLVIYRNLTDPNQLTQTLATNQNFNWKTLFSWNPKLMFAFGLMGYLIIPAMSPPTFQRIAMARDVFQAKSSFTYATVINLLIVLTVVWIGILLLADLPSTSPDQLVHQLIQKYAYSGLKGLMGVGILAFAMSTADSDLNAATVLLTNDVAKALKLSFKKELLVAKGFSLIIGSFALLMALQIQDFLKLVLLTGSFYMPIVTVPLLLTIFGFRSRPRSVLVGMVAGSITVVIWKLQHLVKLDSIVPGMLANLLGLLSSHYIGDKAPNTGWVGIQYKTPLTAAKQAKQRAKRRRRQQFQQFNLYKYLQNNLPKKEIIYTLFGFYVLFATYVPLFKLGEDFWGRYSQLHAVIVHSVLVCTAVLITYPAWPSTFKWKPFIVFFWPLCFGYLSFIVSAILVLLSGFQQLQVLIWLVNLLLAMVLMHWPLVLTMTISGLLIALTWINLLTGLTTFQLAASLSIEFKLFYGMLLFLGFIILLYKQQQEKIQLTAKADYLLGSSLAREQDQFHNLQYQAYLKESLGEPGKDDPMENTKQILTGLVEKMPQEKKAITKAIEQIDAFVAHYKNSFYYTMEYLRLQVREIKLADLLDKLYRILKNAGMQQQVLFQVQTQQKNQVCDPDKITQLLATSIHTLQKQAAQGRKIQLQVQDTQLAYRFKALPNQTRKLAALAFTLTTEDTVAAPEACYQGNTDQPRLTIPASITQLPQREMECIIDAHYGYTESTDSSILHVIPVKLQEIRPKVIDGDPLVAKDLPLDNTASIEQEKALLKELKRKTTIDIRLVKKVIQQTKKFHQGQLRKSGDLFYTHPMTVASLLLDMTQDTDALIAALLHDTVEDTPVGLDQVTYQYGQEVASIVSKVTHLDQTFKKAKLTEVENQLQLAGQQDPRVIMVKLADRLHNMGTIQFLPRKRQQEIAQETLSFYVPLGSMLGLPAVDKVVQEIAERCQRILAEE